MSQGSPASNVRNRAAIFDQQNIIKTGPPPIAKKPKPGVPLKDSNGGINNLKLDNQENGVHSTGVSKKRFTPPHGAFPGIPAASSELNDVRNRLKRAPPPKAPVKPEADSPFPRRPSLNKPTPIKPKPPKPAVIPRKPSESESSSPSSPTSTKDSIPKSDVDSTSLSSSFSDSSLPRTESSTSRTESSTSRRTSGKPELQILPPVEILGSAPPKPRKPISVVLPSPTPTTKPANKRSSILYRERLKLGVPTPGSPAAPEQEDLEQDDWYDDVAATISSPKPRLPEPRKPKARPPSLIPTLDSDEEEGDTNIIPTMDSDEEEGEVDSDLLYDDTAAPPPLPDVSRLPPVRPSLPPTESIPHLPPSHSPLPSTPENSGGNDFGDIYDDVSNPDEEGEELYEALDNDTVEELRGGGDRISLGSGVVEESQEISAKELEAQRRKEEKLKKEQEKQQKKEEERRKKEEERKEKERQKKEREEKKKKEKEEKEAKKRFNIKGDIEVIEAATVIVDCQPEYADKLDLSVSKGDELDILRREGNPPGKWLARDSSGRYGYVSESCVAVEGDSQEVYDDVAAVEPEMEEIYDLVDDQ